MEPLKPVEVITDPERVERITQAFVNHQRHESPCSKRIGRTKSSTCHVMDGKVYDVIEENPLILVYEALDFSKAVRAGRFVNYSPYHEMPFHKARLVFTQDEIDKNGAGCRENDEFQASVHDRTGEIQAILVTRNGKPTNYWSDGTLGVPKEVRELVESEEEYNHPDTAEIADKWVDAEVYEDGTIRRILALRRNPPVV